MQKKKCLTIPKVAIFPKFLKLYPLIQMTITPMWRILKNSVPKTILYSRAFIWYQPNTYDMSHSHKCVSKLVTFFCLKTPKPHHKQIQGMISLKIHVGYIFYIQVGYIFCDELEKPCPIGVCYPSDIIWVQHYSSKSWRVILQ